MTFSVSITCCKTSQRAALGFFKKKNPKMAVFSFLSERVTWKSHAGTYVEHRVLEFLVRSSTVVAVEAMIPGHVVQIVVHHFGGRG